jgi:hypothetical protein
VPVSDSEPDLSWLADSPVFIDSQQIGAFYDAVVGPAFRTVELQISAGKTERLEKSAGGRLSAGLPRLFPWLRVDADVETQRTAARDRHEDQSAVLKPIESAARQLVELSLHYLVNQPERICVVDHEAPLPGTQSHQCQPANDRVRRCAARYQVLAAGCRAQGRPRGHLL